MTDKRVIRVSERQTFKRCRKRWDYSSPVRQNLTSVSSPIALSFGTMMHSTLEKWIEKPTGNPVDLFMEASLEQLEEIKARYRKVAGGTPSEAELDPIYDHVELGRDMISNYHTRWGSPIPEGYTIVQPEQTFQIEVEGTIGVLQGTLDGLLVDDDERYYVLERKTYANRPRLDALNTNDQFLAYNWALEQLLNPSGRQVGGIVYDGMWKRKLDKRHTLPDLFTRHLLIRPPEELAQFGRYLKDEVEEMTDPNVRIYLNRRWEGCFDCPFERLCTAESRGEDAAYVRNKFYVQATEPEEEENDFTSTTA